MASNIFKYTVIIVFLLVFSQMGAMGKIYHQAIEEWINTTEIQLGELDKQADKAGVSRYDLVKTKLSSADTKDHSEGQEWLNLLSFHQRLINNSKLFAENGYGYTLFLLIITYDKSLLSLAIKNFHLDKEITIVSFGYSLFGALFGYVVASVRRFIFRAEAAEEAPQSLRIDEESLREIRMLEQEREDEEASAKNTRNPFSHP